MKTTTMKFGKYVMLSFLALGLTVSSCKKEEPTVEPEPEATFSSHTQVQVPIVLKETGELCPPCGGWGDSLGRYNCCSKRENIFMVSIQ